MSEIQVGQTLYPQVDGNLISQCDMAWAAFLEEMREGSKQFGRNNNEAKEKMLIVLTAMQALNAHIQTLPPQGRMLTFTGKGTANFSELLRRMR